MLGWVQGKRVKLVGGGGPLVAARMAALEALAAEVRHDVRDSFVTLNRKGSAARALKAYRRSSRIIRRSWRT